MTLEEFKQLRRKAEELKKDIPDIYRDILSNYERYAMKDKMLNIRLDILYYELEGVKAVDYSKEKGTYNKDASIEKYYNISDQIAEIEKEKSFITVCLRGLEAMKDAIQDKDIRAKATQCFFNVVL